MRRLFAWFNSLPAPIAKALLGLVAALFAAAATKWPAYAGALTLLASVVRSPFSAHPELSAEASKSVGSDS